MLSALGSFLVDDSGGVVLNRNPYTIVLPAALLFNPYVGRKCCRGPCVGPSCQMWISPWVYRLGIAQGRMPGYADDTGVLRISALFQGQRSVCSCQRVTLGSLHSPNIQVCYRKQNLVLSGQARYTQWGFFLSSCPLVGPCDGGQDPGQSTLLDFGLQP